MEFTWGLVALAMDKLLNDIPNMLYDEHIFSHMIDEVLSFDKELKNTYGYPENQPGCLHVLTQENCFDKWLRVEKKCKCTKVGSIDASLNLVSCSVTIMSLCIFHQFQLL